MNAWRLPTSLNIGDVDWKIRSDFRVILDILIKFNDPDFEADEKQFLCLDAFYIGFSEFLPDGEIKVIMPSRYHEEALRLAIDFIDMGIKEDGKKKLHTMDWEQDASIIIPSVNRVMGQEIRSLPYLHWWTFLGAYMEIGESLFSQVVNIRLKKSKGKKLEKWEKEFYQSNKNLIDLDNKYSAEEIAEKERLNKILG